MSDTTTPDAMTDYLTSRLAQLDVEIAERQAQRAEVERTLAVWSDGRSRVNRKRRGTGIAGSIVQTLVEDEIKRRTGAGTNSAPPATQPDGYDDSVSIEEAPGILRPTFDDPAPLAPAREAADGEAP